MTPRPNRSAQLAFTLALATIALPAHAHALGIGVFVFVILLTGWPAACVLAAVLAPAGRRGLAFGATLLLYPTTYFLATKVLAFMFRNRSDSALDDAQPLVFLAQGTIWIAALIWIATRSRDEE